MKRLKYYLLILCAGAFAACTDLDIPPKNIFNEQDIFGNVEGATSYLARLYGVLPMEDFRYSFEHGFGYSGAMYRQMCCATGEAMHQLAIWTMLEDAGFGASLQHYNPLIDEAVAKQWHINPNWKLIAEMPFGTSTQEPGEKQFAPLEERILVFK